MVDGLFIMLQEIIASLLILMYLSQFSRVRKTKRVYISKKENIDYFIMIKALAKSTHFQ